MKWKTVLTLCLDTETTGLEPGKDRIVEVGAVLYQNGDVLRKECWLVNPGIPIPPEAVAVHGISDASVEKAPALPVIAEELLSLVLEAKVLVGYNWPFDASFFAAELGAEWTNSIEGKYIIDPLVVVRFKQVGRYWKGKRRHQLSAVARRFGIEPEGHLHRASTDCVLTLRILEKVGQYLPEDAARATAIIETRRKEQDADFQAWFAKQKASK